MHMNIGPHLTEDVLETYLLRRFPEADLASVEEHLLVCPKCQVQAEETEEFIIVTQATLRDRARKSSGRSLHTRAGFLYSWVSVSVFAAVAAAISIAVFSPAHRVGTHIAPTQVSLFVVRGPDGMPAHVHAGARLILHLDATGLAEKGDYAVLLVNSSGGEVWTGTSRLSGNRIQAIVGVKLRPGRYWVWLTRAGEPLREYGFQID